MSSDPYSTYKSTQIETSSQEQILLMLYDGCIKYTRQAKQALREGDNKTSHDKLIQAQDIVTELMSTLDMDVGGEIAEELYRLYDFVLHNMIQANVEKDPERLDDVIPVLEELNEAWDEIINEKGMTIDKARRTVSQSSTSSGSGAGEQPESDNDTPVNDEGGDESKPGPRNPSQRPDSAGDDSSFEGNVTYGDI